MAKCNLIIEDVETEDGEAAVSVNIAVDKEFPKDTEEFSLAQHLVIDLHEMVELIYEKPDLWKDLQEAIGFLKVEAAATDLITNEGTLEPVQPKLVT